MKFNKLVPELAVSDFDKSLNFYNKVLGFKIEYTRDDFAFISLQGSHIMIEQSSGYWSTGKLEKPFGRGINFQLGVKSVAPLIKSLKKNKIKLFVNVHDNWYRKGTKLLGCREFLVQDPDGYLLRFSQDIGTKKVSSKK